MSAIAAAQVGTALPASGSPAEGTDAAGVAAVPSADEIFRRVFGKDRPPIAAGRYPVLLDGQQAGTFMIDPAGDGRIDSAFVADVLLPIMIEEQKLRFKSLIAGKQRVGFDELRSLGLAVTFDPGELALSVGVPMNMRSARPLRLRGGRARPQLALVEQADVSGYAAFRGGIDVVAQAGRGKKGFSGFASDIDLGLNIRGIAFQGRVRYAERGERRWTRSDFRATYDDVDRLIRYEAGDLSLGRRNYQRGGRIFGLSARREYRIDPYLNIRPSGSREFQIEQAARIDVMVNGRPGRTFSLPPGRYSLQDFALVPAAANDVEIRITYASGEVETIRFPAFYDIDLLAPGLFEFSVNAGVPYRDEQGVRRYDAGDFNLLGYARYGLSSVLTAGVSLEGNEDFTNLGGEVTWASPVGSFFAAVSTDARAASLATGSALIRYSWRDLDQLRGRSLDAQLVLTGRDYQTLDSIFGGNFTALSSQVRFGQMLGPRMRIQVTGGFDKVRDFGEFERSGENWFVSAGATYQAALGTISAGMDYVRSNRGRGLGANVSLFVPLGRGTISSSYYTRDNAARLEYNRLAALGVGSVGLASGVERRDGADRQFARGSYLGNRFEGFVDVVRSASERARDTRAALGFGSAIVMADGAVGISRPVYNSFAIVRGPGEGGYLVEPRTGLGATDTRYTAHTDWLGAAVIPDLQPYLERPIQVDAKDERATPGAGTIFNLKPGFRSGFLVKPAAEQGGGGESVVGVLVDSNGAPIPFASGEARRVRSPDPEPKLVFTNGSGRFILDGVEAGEKYELSITADGQTSRTVLEVPREARGLTRLDTPIKLNLLREKDDAL